MREVGDHPELATQFTQFSRTVERDDGDLYRAVCLRVAADPELLALLDGAEPAQRRPNLLLNSVHHLLLGGAEHPLADLYATVVHHRGTGSYRTADEVEVGDRFADFCSSHRAAIEGLVATRATQTNEIGRCAALLPALATVTRRTGAPASVIDLGTSAGLNLLFDRYAYSYTAADGGAAVEAGDPTSAVRIECTLRGDAVPPLGLPDVAGRRGVDLRPADLTDPDDARWLLACLWPHQLDRFVRLEAALALADALPVEERPAVTRGDLIAEVGALVEASAPDGEPCVFHSWVAAYLTPAEQRSLCGAMRDASSDRRVWWIFAEAPFDAPELPFTPAPGGHEDRSATVLMLVRCEGGALHAERLADMHHHGAWLHWWGAG